MGDYSISDLSALSVLPVRTIRYYIAEGLLPSAGREGPATRYPESTLARLRLIRKLQHLHLPLAEIRKRLATMSDDEVVGLAAEPAPTAPEGSALDYVRSLLAGEQAVDVPSPGRLMQPRSMREALVHETAVPYPAAETPAPVNQQQALGERSAWERISLGPDIELHVRRPLSRRDNRQVERLIAFARQLQEEEAP